MLSIFHYVFGVLLPLIAEFVVVLGTQTPYPPFFTPCTFPSPIHQPIQFHSLCTVFPRVPFLCDLHQQLSHSGSAAITHAFNKHKAVFSTNSSISLGIVIVRQLAPPPNVDVVYRNRNEYGCLFEDECTRMDVERVQKFVSSAKMFTKIYASTLYERWFAESHDNCNQANILALIILDGLVNDVRKLPYVKIHTGEARLLTVLSNIQMESTNAILQGWPLHMVVADLVEQLGYALREFYALNGGVRVHLIPPWAVQVFILCAVLVVVALLVEWYIVRRKLAVKRSISGIQLNAAKSKTHLMF
ncbi:hypothetical protein Tcan_11721 [Toxocara canis]|uniref:Uncharacterized protein n=1 Tax=Toxocara canis TaxID=6265 RepID=A0A0B2UVT4_TOXCA|nr:hypothetical protein Tcan_11721 [Toxocara canis]